jgi:hypothetical protein
MHIDEKDVIILDFIIDKILEFDFAIWSNTLTENGFLIEYDEKNREYEFRRLISVINALNYGKSRDYSHSWDSIERNEHTLKFKERGGFKKYFQDELDRIDKAENIEKLKTKNLELQNENLEFSKTIRQQEAKIRHLELKIKGIELIKQYWWFIGLCIFVGVGLKELLDILIAYIKQ